MEQDERLLSAVVTTMSVTFACSHRAHSAPTSLLALRRHLLTIRLPTYDSLSSSISPCHHHHCYIIALAMMMITLITVVNSLFSLLRVLHRYSPIDVHTSVTHISLYIPVLLCLSIIYRNLDEWKVGYVIRYLTNNAVGHTPFWKDCRL